MESKDQRSTVKGQETERKAVLGMLEGNFPTLAQPYTCLALRIHRKCTERSGYGQGEFYELRLFK